MAFGAFDGEGRAAPMAEINTTPLVDVMLVLLVIFIITAPLFTQAVQVNLPRVAGTALDVDTKPIHVTLAPDGRLYLDGVQVDRARLERHFAALGPKNPELHLHADRNTRYEAVAELLAAAQRHGIVRIAFVTAAPGREESER